MTVTTTTTVVQTRLNEPKMEFKPVIVWRNVVLMSAIHAGALYGMYLMATQAMWSTSICAVLLYVFSGLGITAGAHRLWSHKSYKAKLPLRILLAFAQSMALQNSIYEWVRDHRVHHKFSDTDADPHNSQRGFFFSHVGWLLMKKHPAVKAKGSKIELHDISSDPVVAFQNKHYYVSLLVAWLLVPMAIPMYFWGETAMNAYFVCVLWRYCWTLNMTWLVNSAAHFFGNKPYDISMMPSENWFVALVANGEGWHNFHHAFPFDYKTAELPYTLNITTMFLDLMGLLGQAYDFKTATPAMVKARIERTGSLDHHHAVEGDY